MLIITVFIVASRRSLFLLITRMKIEYGMYCMTLFIYPPLLITLKINDQVRISKIKRKFEKGYLPNFSKEIFTVSKTIPRRPPVYKIKDYDGDELHGTFYEEELQKVFKHNDTYKIEKILKKCGKGKNVKYLVKW